MSLLFANVIVDISHEKLDRTFQYIIPEELIKEISPGILVNIPFGKGNRLINGYVIEVTENPEFDIDKMKYIDGIDKESLPIESQLIRLAAWIKENYGSTMNKALKTVIPVKQKINPQNKKWVRLNVNRDEAYKFIEKYKDSKKYYSRYMLLKELLIENEIEISIVINNLNVSRAVIKAMAEKGIIEISTEYFLRNPIKNSRIENNNIILTETQKSIVDSISRDISNGIRTPSLIFGVTGSGKTEIYIELIKKCLSDGKQAIVLIPEIALVFQNVKRFYRVFGNRVSVINSKMSVGERHDQFERAKKGDVDIIIGPRSALFTPFKNLGLIVIDEEQEGSYKSENIPKYHARETAIKRAQIADANVILGSATPSVESYYKTKTDEYKIYYLKTRIGESELPKIHLIDLREELLKGNKSIFSEKLDELIIDRLKRKEQIMLFINRRGFSGFMSCRSCGHGMKCPHCDVGLTLHNNGKLMCHYCGFKTDIPKLCPTCSSKHIAAFGIGTQKIETFVKEKYPDANVLRMDMDTTSKKDDYEKILTRFSSGEADILIGTQMIVKGHDFPNVTLVGIIAADLSLYASDYKASERTFQIITQAAGRAGRGKRAGEVVAQTYSVDNYSIQAALNQDYDEFFNQEIAYRKLMGYPPIVSMVAILFTSKDEKNLNIGVEKISDLIDNNDLNGIMKIGPSDGVISKINDVYRKVIYLKHQDVEEIIVMKDIIERFKENNKEEYKNIGIQFDFSPMSNY